MGSVSGSLGDPLGCPQGILIGLAGVRCDFRKEQRTDDRSGLDVDLSVGDSGTGDDRPMDDVVYPWQRIGNRKEVHVGCDGIDEGGLGTATASLRFIAWGLGGFLLGRAGKALGGSLVVLKEGLIGTTLSGPRLILGFEVCGSNHIFAADDLARDWVNVEDGAGFVIDVAV